MQENYVKQIEIDELVELVSLTEKTVEEINKLKSRIWIYIIVLASLAVLFFWAISFVKDIQHDIDAGYGILLLPSLIVFSSIAILVLFREINRISKRIRIETKIARKLFDMIGPLKSNVNESVSLTKMALIEMRLNRIGFDNIKKSEFF